MKKTPLLLLIIPLTLTFGCNQKTYEDHVKNVNCNIKSFVSNNEDTHQNGYDVSFVYKDSCFALDATRINKDLVLLSYGASMSAVYEKNMISFYNALEFDDIESHYVVTSGSHTISYSFAHKEIWERHVIAVNVRGFEYENEWIDNFDMGLTGNHHGFEQSALQIYSNLKTYFNKYNNPKLWLTGYSRAGAVINVLSHQILSKKEININKKDMYVYTFEAPKGLAIENKIPYENVFNFINSRDLLVYAAPEEQYGLCRCGIDVDFYNENYKTLISDFDIDIVLKDFIPDSVDYPTEEDFYKYAIDQLTRQAEHGSIHTREEFCNNLFPIIETGLNVYYSLSEEQIDELVKDVKDQYKEQGYMMIINLLMVEGSLYDFLTPYLDRIGYQYEEQVLRPQVEFLRQFAVAHIGVIGSFLLSESSLGNNLLRGGFMHAPDVNYPLIKEYAK